MPFDWADSCGGRLLSFVFPSRCPSCDGLLRPWEAPGLCPQCQRMKRLTSVREPLCMHCGRPLTDERVQYCPQCAKKDLSQSFTEGKSLFVYGGTVSQMIFRFKYRGRQEYARFFAAEAQSLWAEWLARTAPEIIIPVPMYRKKERRRGYNQAERFGRELSRCLGVPCSDRLLVRLRNTQPMKELTEEERRQNLLGAFFVPDKVLPYSRVLLVDDIYTTGATAEAVSQALYRAGVKEVYFLSVSIGAGL